MKKVLYIIGLTSAVFLLSAAEQEKESWWQFGSEVVSRVGRLLEAGAGAVMHGAQAVVENPETQNIEEGFVYTGPAQFIGHEYQEVEGRLNYLHALVIAAHSYEYDLLSGDEKERFEAFIQEFKRRLTDQKIAPQVSAEVAELERRIKNKLAKEAGKQHKSRKLTELYDSFVKKTAVDQEELEEVLGEY